MREKSAPRKKPMHGREKAAWPMGLAVGASVCGAGGKHWSKHRAKLADKPPHKGKRAYFMHQAGFVVAHCKRFAVFRKRHAFKFDLLFHGLYVATDHGIDPIVYCYR
jgi:hypothetical protein